MASMDEEFRQHFRGTVECIFNNWQNLRLAVEHGMGGRNGQQTAIDILNYTYEYVVNNPNATVGELQDVIEDLMDQEFNTLCDDGSIQELSSNLLRLRRMTAERKYAEIEADLDKFPKGKEWLRPDVKINYTSIDDESSSSSGDDDEDMDCDMDDDSSDQPATPSGKSKSNEFVEPEPGWTTVRRK